MDRQLLIHRLGRLSPERRLIGRIANADWSQGTDRTWPKAWFCGIDWEKLCAAAWQYKMRPMVAKALREAGWQGVPAGVRAAIENAERECAEKAMWQIKLLSAIAADASRQDIRVFALKGIALSFHLYDNPFIREAFDLDFLIHPDDEARFVEVLRANDCLDFSAPPLPPRQAALLRTFQHERKFWHPAGRIAIESHHRLDFNRHLVFTDFDALWAARTTVDIGQSSIALFGARDLIHYLGIHAEKHQWERWKWVADLVMLFRRAKPEALVACRDHAARSGNATLFDNWILLCLGIADAVLPTEIECQALNNRRANTMASRTLRASASERTLANLTGHRHVLALTAHRLSLKRNWRYACLELLALLHNENDWRRLRLPDWLFFFHYLSRPILYVTRRIGAGPALFK